MSKRIEILRENAIRNLQPIIGQKFGKLTVVGFEPHEYKNGKKRILLVCKCECGGESKAPADAIRNGNTKSCGCEQIAAIRKDATRRAGDMVGKKFNRLTVLERAGSDKYQNATWKCKCDCGNETTVAGNSLRNGNTKSCGCYKTEQLSKPKRPELTQEERAKMKRNYNLGYKAWVKEVMKVNNKTCMSCGRKATTAHHINSWSDNKELRLVASNGVSLCKECHDKFHKIYGKGKNTEAQWQEWLNK
jgi:5-methylcytosine-specific restriction endonuclease McrA